MLTIRAESPVSIPEQYAVVDDHVQRGIGIDVSGSDLSVCVSGVLNVEGNAGTEAAIAIAGEKVEDYRWELQIRSGSSPTCADHQIRPSVAVEALEQGT